MRLSWRDLGTPRADKAHGKPVEITGFPVTILPTATADHFLLMAEPGCCQGCVPNNPLAVIEVVADRPLSLGNGALRLAGTWQISPDPDGWRYQLHAAQVKPGLSRRAMLAASPLFCLPATAMAQATDGTAVDIHSHAGNLIQMSANRGSFSPVADPMRQGGMSTICLAIVADSPTVTVINGRLRPGRDGRPGEFYAFSQRAFPAAHALAREQGMRSSRPPPTCARRGRRGLRSSSLRKARTSSKARSSASTKPISAGSSGTSSSRTTAPTNWATSRPSSQCMAA